MKNLLSFFKQMVLTVFPTFWLPPLPYAFSNFLKAISGIALILQLLAWINVTYFWKISGLLAIEFNIYELSDADSVRYFNFWKLVIW